jgi:putative endonuclease
MTHYIYIIYSPSEDLYYKGESADVFARIEKHNANESTYTANKGPWELVYIEKLESRSVALKREKQIKKLNRRSIGKLILSESNNLKNEKLVRVAEGVSSHPEG